MKTADQFLSEGAATFKERNAVYGDNYKNVGKAMEGFFPKGVTLKTADDWNRMHILLLSIVKLTRYCNQWSAGGHADSVHDAMVYDAMLESIDAEIAGRPKNTFLGMDFGDNGDKTMAALVNKDGQLISSIEICEGCLSPQTCASQQDCLGIITQQDVKQTFAPCNKCVTTEMCTQEDHCDRTCNGYR